MPGERVSPQPAGDAREYLLTRLPTLPESPPLPRWHLDSPVNLAPFQPMGVNFFRLAGWVLSTAGECVHVAVRSAGTTRSFALNTSRGDMIEKLLGQASHAHPLLTWRFELAPVAAPMLDVGVELGGLIVWLFNFSRVDQAAGG